MSIQVKLYGELSEKSHLKRESSLPITLNFEENEINTVSNILEKLTINMNEVSHIFVNGKYSGPGKNVINGDQVGLFPKNMALMFIEIKKNNDISVKVRLFADLLQYGPPESIIEIPEGTLIKSILEKFNLINEKRKLIILINGIPCHENNHVLNNNDIIAIFPPLAGG